MSFMSALSPLGLSLSGYSSLQPQITAGVTGEDFETMGKKWL